MSLRSTVAGLAAAAVVAAFSVHASLDGSEAADRGQTRSRAGHAATQETMEALVRQGRVPGVLGRAEDVSGAWSGTAGVADRRSGRPRRPGDRFRVGSITKTFVATVVLQLEAEGRLDLDDPVARYLPGTVSGHGHDGRRITLRQLLNHTSGVFDFTADPAYRDAYVGPGFLAHRFDSHTARELVGIAMRHPPAFPPGSDWGYSNTNYVLAGMVIEAVTGHGYAREIEERLLEPLGLRRTSLPGTSAGIRGRHGRAYSTLRPDGRLPEAGGGARRVHDVTALDPSLAGASGEMVSTAADLIDFYRALFDGRVLPARQLAQMTHTVATGEAGHRYGLGIRARDLSCGTTVWGHGGGIHGSDSTAATTRDGEHAAAFNLNADWVPYRRSSRRLLEAEFCG